MVIKTKKSRQKAPQLILMVCETCGATVEVPSDSVCYHCGCKMSISKRWRRKYDTC